MKVFKKSIAIMLSLFSLFTTVSCKDKDGNDDFSGGVDVPVEDCVGSIENSKIESTGKYILKDGVTDYKIVIPEEAGANIILATEEINLFFKEATGTTFDVVTDAQIGASANEKYISIGATKLRQEAGISVREDLGTSGTQMITKGEDIFLFGRTDLASLYAAYDFLAYVLDFDYIYKNCYNLDKNVTDIELKAYNEVNIPDIEYRCNGYGWTYGDTLEMNRMRLQYYFANIVSVNGLQVHNSFNYVSRQIKGHESFWYSDDKTQLCYTAHGNEEEYELMQEACLESLKEALMADTQSTIVTMTQQDVQTNCSCDACKEVAGYYGAVSAVQLLFVNELRGRLDEWFASDEGQPYYRDLDLIFFSYHNTATAPATYDKKTNTYTANHGIKCADGVSVWYAPIHGDFTHSLYHEKNEGVLQTIRSWQIIDDEGMFLWVYSAPFTNYFVWYNNFDSMQDTYKLAREVGASYVFDQAQFNTTDSYSWGALKSYLTAKLAWNPDADLEFYTDRFFENYFGQVSDEMKEYYLKQRVYLKWLSENTNYSCPRSCSNADIGNAKYWPKSILMSWLNEVNAIIAGLEDLKRENFEEYNKYYYRIANERTSILYMLVELYSSSIPTQQLMEYKLQFKADALALGMDVTNEGSNTIPAILNNWGV